VAGLDLTLAGASLGVATESMLFGWLFWINSIVSMLAIVEVSKKTIESLPSSLLSMATLLQETHNNVIVRV
jgi:hypothetical protein